MVTRWFYIIPKKIEVLQNVILNENKIISNDIVFVIFHCEQVYLILFPCEATIDTKKMNIYKILILALIVKATVSSVFFTYRIHDVIGMEVTSLYDWRTVMFSLLVFHYTTKIFYNTLILWVVKHTKSDSSLDNGESSVEKEEPSCESPHRGRLFFFTMFLDIIIGNVLLVTVVNSIAGYDVKSNDNKGNGYLQRAIPFIIVYEFVVGCVTEWAAMFQSSEKYQSRVMRLLNVAYYCASKMFIYTIAIDYCTMFHAGTDPDNHFTRILYCYIYISPFSIGILSGVF